MVQRLIRKRCLDRCRFGSDFRVAVDATGYDRSSVSHGDHCLTQTSNGHTTYYHLVLEAKLVSADGLAISLATEFVENPSLNPTKQDCEYRAFARLLKRLRLDFPQLHICLLLDGLYADSSILQQLTDAHCEFLISFKEGKLPACFEEFERLRKLSPANRLRVDQRKEGKTQEFSWVNGLPIGEHKVDVVECVETREGEPPIRFVWISGYRVDERNVEAMTNRGARLRWKIENEGFNEQKNGGPNLNHAYSWDANAAKNFYLLLQIAEIIRQLLVRGNLLPASVGAYGGLRAVPRRLLESLRGFSVPAETFDLQEAARIHVYLRPLRV